MNRNTRLLVAALLGTLVGLQLAPPNRQSTTSSADDQQSQASREQPSSLLIRGKWVLYDSDPNHIWNRLYRSLYVRIARDGREYGYDELDPLLWYETKYLLSGTSWQQAIDLLDEFLSMNAERLVADPLKRALLQHDLWAIFDWSTQRPYEASRQKRELQIRLAQAIRRLALPKDQIERLPNNYAGTVASKAFLASYDPNQRQTAFLPSDLFQSRSPWMPLSAYGGGLVARVHALAFSGRSVFLVFMRLPGGREATLAYIEKLLEYSQPWIQHPQEPDKATTDPGLPQFPLGTQLALVRQMILIDNQGNLTPTNLTEQVQIRVHRAIPSTIHEGLNLDSNEAKKLPDTFEFKLSRQRLFAGESGGLRAVTRDEKEFPLFQSHGFDLFDENDALERHLRPTLSFCASCHFRPGIHSVLSRERRKLTASWDSKYEANSTIAWKHSCYDWGLLQGLWEFQPTARSR